MEDILIIVYFGNNESKLEANQVEKLRQLIEFESFENFKNLFSKAAATRFGSGWATL